LGLSFLFDFLFDGLRDFFEPPDFLRLALLLSLAILLLDSNFPSFWALSPP
jgi:hypothetical protein